MKWDTRALESSKRCDQCGRTCGPIYVILSTRPGEYFCSSECAISLALPTPNEGNADE